MTKNIPVPQDQLPEPIRAADLIERGYVAGDTAQLTIVRERLWDDSLLFRVAITTGLTAAAMLIFVAGYLVGVGA